MRQRVVAHTQANLLGELAKVERLRGNLDSALRLATYGARVDLVAPSRSSSRAAVELATTVSQSHWSRLLSGHEGAVQSAAFSGDGSRIVTASFDRTARLWDAATGKEIAVLRGHEDIVRSAAFSGDGVAHRHGVLRQAPHGIWDAATGKEIAVLRGHEERRAVRRLQPRRIAHRHGVR